MKDFKGTQTELHVDGYELSSVITKDENNNWIKVATFKKHGVDGNDSLLYTEENHANAKLFAASKEMLKSLYALKAAAALSLSTGIAIDGQLVLMNVDSAIKTALD